MTLLIGLYFGYSVIFGKFETNAECEVYKTWALAEHVLGRIELKCVTISTDKEKA